MDILHILILGLAIWRGASLLSSERGPYAIFERFRAWCGVYYVTENGYEVAKSDRELGKMISCPYCNSIWLAAIASILYITLGIVAVWMALPLALSALALVVGSLVDR